MLTADKMIELRQRAAIEKPHIIAVNEVLPKNGAPRDDQDFSIKHFSMHRWSAGRGIIIWTHVSLDKSISVPSSKKLNSSATEAAFIKIRLHKGDTLLFGCTYRSPNSGDEGNDKTNELLTVAAKEASHVNMCGDYNYPEINWSTQSCPGRGR